MAIQPLQTTYARTMAPYIVGQIPDMRTPGEDISRNVETVNGIGFGVAVAQGIDDNGCRPFGTGATKFLGVTVLDKTTLANNYPQYSTARVRTEGPIVVVAAAAVAAGDKAYMVQASGAFTNVAAGDVIGVFETSGAAGTPVVLVLK